MERGAVSWCQRCAQRYSCSRRLRQLPDLVAEVVPLTKLLRTLAARRSAAKRARRGCLPPRYLPAHAPMHPTG